MSKKELYDVTVPFKRETERAILVLNDHGEEVWLPKSQIEYDLRSDDQVEITMPAWLASEKRFV